MSSNTDFVIDIVIDIIGNREVEDETANRNYAETGSYLGSFVFWQNPVIGSVVGSTLGSFVDLYFSKGASKYVRDILDEMPEKSRKSIAKKIMSIIDELGFEKISKFQSYYKKNCKNKQDNTLRKFCEKSVALIKAEAERYSETSFRKPTKEDGNRREKYRNVTDESKTSLTRKNEKIPNKKDKAKRRVKVSSSSDSNEESSEKSFTDESEESEPKVERSTKKSSTSEKEKKQKYKLKSQRSASLDRNKKERKSKHSKRSSSLEKSKKKDEEKKKSKSNSRKKRETSSESESSSDDSSSSEKSESSGTDEDERERSFSAKSKIRRNRFETEFKERTQFSRDKRNTVKWIESSDGRIPEHAVCGGYDINGEELYVGRVKVQNHLIPGKIVSSHRCCYVSYSGKEYSRPKYEVLTNSNDVELVWLSPRRGQLPPDTIEGGKEENGDLYYVGRAEYENSLVVGKVHQTYGTLYVPFAGQEISFNVYEVLCIRK